LSRLAEEPFHHFQYTLEARLELLENTFESNKLIQEERSIMLPIAQPVPLRQAVVSVLFVILLMVAAYSQVPQTAVPDNQNQSPRVENLSQGSEKPMQSGGTFFAALRTQNHIARSDSNKFNETVDGVEQFLTFNKVVLREDPVRTKFRLESTMSKENLIHVAEDAGASYVLQLTVDRPATSWIELTMQCFDLQGKQLWEERGSGANQFSSSGHVQKAVKKLTSRVAPKLGSDCLSQSEGTKPVEAQSEEKKR
jgi:hypothetical protein